MPERLTLQEYNDLIAKEAFETLAEYGAAKLLPLEVAKKEPEAAPVVEPVASEGKEVVVMRPASSQETPRAEVSVNRSSQMAERIALLAEQAPSEQELESLHFFGRDFAANVQVEGGPVSHVRLAIAVRGRELTEEEPDVTLVLSPTTPDRPGRILVLKQDPTAVGSQQAYEELSKPRSRRTIFEGDNTDIVGDIAKRSRLRGATVLADSYSADPKIAQIAFDYRRRLLEKAFPQPRVNQQSGTSGR